MNNEISMGASVLTLRNSKTYMLAALFIVGNILLPQLCHLVPNGGHVWLPIYLFTLVGACCYGLHVGVLTAIASPLVNHLLFGMPGNAALPSILVKSVLLAVFAAYLFHRKGSKADFWAVLSVVLGYQVLGSLAECMIEGSLVSGFTDFKMGLPGMALQIIVGYLLTLRKS